MRHRSAFSPSSGLFGLFIFLNNTRLIVERVATGGSVALTFQLSFKQNLPALYSESTAHPDRKKKKKKTCFPNTVSLLFSTLNQCLAPQTGHVLFRQLQKQIFFSRKEEKGDICFFAALCQKIDKLFTTSTNILL